MKLEESIVNFINPEISNIGFAPVERFDGAPEKHHPKNVCEDAQTVIVFTIPIPEGIMKSPDYNLHTLHRSYHTVYTYLDELALKLCNHVESLGSHLAVPVPSYAPLKFHDMEPWGIISLKHAAVRAGIGRFGHNGLMYNSQYGFLLRLGAIVTDLKLQGTPLLEGDPCLPGCDACHKVCPSKAFDEKGAFHKMNCLGYCIKHANFPLVMEQDIELVINTAGYNYWLACDECLKVCPINRIKSPKKVN
jgi:epoxyqueuosine reductase QueG